MVWTSHTDTETPFRLREKERKREREHVPIRTLCKGDGQELEVVDLIRPLLSSGYQLHYRPFSEMIYNT